MNFLRETKLFGSRRRTEIILLLSMLEESYAAELARLLNAKLYSVQTILDGLENEGVIASRMVGKERRITLNPRLAYSRELRALVQKIAEGERSLIQIVESRRTRPRKKGKAL